MGGLNSTTIFNIAVPIIFLGAFYLFIMLPQRKREQRVKDMRDSLKPGDEVVTIGGITGKVVKVTEEHVTIEVGADKTKLSFEKWGIGKKIEK